MTATALSRPVRRTRTGALACRLAVAGALALMTGLGLTVGQGQAAAATSISGAVIKSDSGTRVAGAPVSLSRWNGSGWTYLGVRTYTNANGHYDIYGLANGYYYYTGASSSYGVCPYTALYVGYGQYFYAAGGARGANIRISYWGNPCYRSAHEPEPVDAPTP